MSEFDPTKGLEELRDPFPKSAINQIPRGGTKIDYVGHAHVTERLLDIDLNWNWEPAASTEEGYPILERDDQGRPMGLWIKLTILGVTRYGYGTANPNKDDAVKELIGDAIRNASMRFGVALDLWKKEPPEQHTPHRQTPQNSPRQEQPSEPAPQGDPSEKAKLIPMRKRVRNLYPDDPAVKDESIRDMTYEQLAINYPKAVE